MRASVAASMMRRVAAVSGRCSETMSASASSSSKPRRSSSSARSTSAGSADGIEIDQRHAEGLQPLGDGAADTPGAEKPDGAAAQLAAHRPQRVDVEAALPQLRVREGEPAQHGEDQHHRVLGDADGRAAGRDGERDAALGQRRGVDGVVVADALVVHEGELPRRPRSAAA